jgi:hypothetical protein
LASVKAQGPLKTPQFAGDLGFWLMFRILYGVGSVAMQVTLAE